MFNPKMKTNARKIWNHVVQIANRKYMKLVFINYGSHKCNFNLSNKFNKWVYLHKNIWNVLLEIIFWTHDPSNKILVVWAEDDLGGFG